MADELGDLPEATTEPPERFPGGADSIADEEKYGEIPDAPTVPDLEPDSNPAVDDMVPAEITEPDDKQQAPEGAADDQETGEEDTPEAGQENEEGDPEEPA
ncbi:MAG: hypothetical protein V9G04_02240 [Nocardioides sp.]|jgi:hypothetical protein